MIGAGLVVQHYVAEEATPTYCRMNSISDVFTAAGRTQVNVIWELTAAAIDEAAPAIPTPSWPSSPRRA